MKRDSAEHVRRNFALFFIPIILLGLSTLLLVWAIVRINLPSSMQSNWPWKLQLLDIQSATTVVTIVAGLIFARAQFASAVRPMAGWRGRVVEARGYSSKLVWLVRVVNRVSVPASFHSLEYCVNLESGLAQKSQGKYASWMSRAEAISLLSSVGLKEHVDYELNYFGSNIAISNSYDGGVLAIFTRRAMKVIDDVLIRVQITDQSGDTRQITIYCLLGAVRDPKGPTIA
jgi:hypothetical protein